jgi:hypothetical protein
VQTVVCFVRLLVVVVSDRMALAVPGRNACVRAIRLVIALRTINFVLVVNS